RPARGVSRRRDHRSRFVNDIDHAGASSEAATVRSNTYGDTSPRPVSVHDAIAQYTMMKMASASDEFRGRVVASISSATKIARQSASPSSPSSRYVAYQLLSIANPLNDLFVNP